MPIRRPSYRKATIKKNVGQALERVSTQSAARGPTCEHFMQNDWLNAWPHYQTPHAKCQQDLGALRIFPCCSPPLGLLHQSLAMSGA